MNKGSWSEAEDKLLLELINKIEKKYGKYAEISRSLPGRTRDSIRNRVRTLDRKNPYDQKI